MKTVHFTVFAAVVTVKKDAGLHEIEIQGKQDKHRGYAELKVNE